jgi:hypothetical protein
MVYKESLVFLGSGRNESIGIYRSTLGSLEKISTPLVDEILASKSETELTRAVIEGVDDFLLLHLEDRTLVMDLKMTGALGSPFWFEMTKDCGRFFAKMDSYWLCFHNQEPWVGVLSDTPTRWGEVVGWQAYTETVFTDTNVSLIRQIKIFGSVDGDGAPFWLSYSENGSSWFEIMTVSDGYNMPTFWNVAMVRDRGFMRIRGDSTAQVSISGLKATMQSKG